MGRSWVDYAPPGYRAKIYSRLKDLHTRFSRTIWKNFVRTLSLKKGNEQQRAQIVRAKKERSVASSYVQYQHILVLACSFFRVEPAKFQETSCSPTWHSSRRGTHQFRCQGRKLKLMLRVAARTGRQRLTGYSSRLHFNGAPSTLARSFFSFGGKSDDNSNSEGSNGSNDETSNNNSNSSGGDSSQPISSAVVPSSKLKYGDEAPRYPHTLALPLVSRPLFPGVFTSITISDPVR